MSIDLKAFCAQPDFGRYVIEFPFKQGEHVYATDGRVLVRVSGDTPFERPADANAGLVPPDPTKVGPWNQNKLSDADFVLVLGLNIPPVRVETCPDCEGMKAVKYGTATTITPCAEDDPDAQTCENCDGHGQITHNDRVAVGENSLSNRYLYLIATLPNCRIGTKRTAPQDSRHDKLDYGPVPFIFDGGCGYLMPMKEAK